MDEPNTFQHLPSYTRSNWEEIIKEKQRYSLEKQSVYFFLIIKHVQLRKTKQKLLNKTDFSLDNVLGAISEVTLCAKPGGSYSWWPSSSWWQPSKSSQYFRAAIWSPSRRRPKFSSQWDSHQKSCFVTCWAWYNHENPRSAMPASWRYYESPIGTRTDTFSIQGLTTVSSTSM